MAVGLSQLQPAALPCRLSLRAWNLVYLLALYGAALAYSAPREAQAVFIIAMLLRRINEELKEKKKKERRNAICLGVFFQGGVKLQVRPAPPHYVMTAV